MVAETVTEAVADTEVDAEAAVMEVAVVATEVVAAATEVVVATIATVTTTRADVWHG